MDSYWNVGQGFCIQSRASLSAGHSALIIFWDNTLLKWKQHICCEIRSEWSTSVLSVWCRKVVLSHQTADRYRAAPAAVGRLEPGRENRNRRRLRIRLESRCTHQSHTYHQAVLTVLILQSMRILYSRSVRWKCTVQGAETSPISTMKWL